MIQERPKRTFFTCALSWSAVGDHGIRAQGEGWLLTVALIEGVNLPKADVTGFSDPYVVFTCNGMSRTSSVKLQTLNPEWNGGSLFSRSIASLLF